MNNLELKYGCNPHQKSAKVYLEGSNLPLEVLNGKPGFINLLDALNAYQLVRELDLSLSLPSAASFKHLSPAGAAVAVPLNEKEKKMYFSERDELSDLAIAYTRARGADRMSSFGDFVALSRECDESTARCISREVSDGVIAPSFSEKALQILKKKKKGGYNIITIDPSYIPATIEKRTVYGITFEQERNDTLITKEFLKKFVTESKTISEETEVDLIVALISLKYTQSNSVCYSYRGQTIGVGAGQQSRIHCTRLAGSKADNWLLRTSEKVLNLPFKSKLSRNTKDNLIEQYLSDNAETDLFEESFYKEFFLEKPSKFTLSEKREFLSKIKGVSLASDAFFPFRDNIDRAVSSGVSTVVQPGGSLRDSEIINACNELEIPMIFTGLRLFHH